MQLDLGNTLATTLYSFIYITIVGMIIDYMVPSNGKCDKYQGKEQIQCVIDNLKQSTKLRKDRTVYYLVAGVLSILLGYYLFYRTDNLQSGFVIITGGMFLLLLSGIMGSDNGSTNYSMFYIIMAFLTVFLAIAGIMFFQILGMYEYKCLSHN